MSDRGTPLRNRNILKRTLRTLHERSYSLGRLAGFPGSGFPTWSQLVTGCERTLESAARERHDTFARSETENHALNVCYVGPKILHDNSVTYSLQARPVKGERLNIQVFGVDTKATNNQEDHHLRNRHSNELQIRVT